ncbi:MAG: hypothetical protein M0Z71_00460, partial [Nitrospiraceae bacterium]|nr:hypothetical protein [Nitrospiraceae bacterium]
RLFFVSFSYMRQRFNFVSFFDEAIRGLDNAPNMGYLVTIGYITVTKCGTDISNDRKKVIKSYIA